MKYIGAHISKDTTIMKTIHNMSNNNGNVLQFLNTAYSSRKVQSLHLLLIIRLIAFIGVLNLINS